MNDSDFTAVSNLIHTLDQAVNVLDSKPVKYGLNVVEGAVFGPLIALGDAVTGNTSSGSSAAPSSPNQVTSQNLPSRQQIEAYLQTEVTAGNARQIHVSPEQDPRVASLVQTNAASQLAAVQPSGGHTIGIGLMAEGSVQLQEWFPSLPGNSFVAGSVGAGFYMAPSQNGWYLNLGGGFFSIASAPVTGLLAFELTWIWDGGVDVFAGTALTGTVVLPFGDTGVVGGVSAIVSLDPVSWVGMSFFLGGGTPAISGNLQIAHTFVTGYSPGN